MQRAYRRIGCTGIFVLAFAACLSGCPSVEPAEDEEMGEQEDGSGNASVVSAGKRGGDHSSQGHRKGDDEWPGEDDGEDADAGAEEDAGTDADSGAEEDAGTDADAGADTEPGTGFCSHGGGRFPGAYHCDYETAFVKKNCYEYASGVSRAVAESDCKRHRQGGSLMAQNPVFGEGPCALNATGYCITATQTPCGREYQVSPVTNPANDCKPGILTSAAWACETMGSGNYVCTL